MMTRKIPMPSNTDNVADSAFNLFARNDGFWWPYRSLARALFGTQNNALGYLTANKRLLDEMRNIIRREQDLALEISEMTVRAMAHEKSIIHDLAHEPILGVFERATSGVRELGYTWIDAQVRALDAMRSMGSATGASTAAHGHGAPAATE